MKKLKKGGKRRHERCANGWRMRETRRGDERGESNGP